MTDTVDLLIRARFDAVANPTDGRDWNDVLARVRSAEPAAERSARRRPASRRWLPARIVLVAAVVALAMLLTAVAFGWPQRVVDFFTSPPAPTKVKNFVALDNVGAPPGMNPRAIPGATRKITTARFDSNGGPASRPTLHTLYVAPRKGGGFCYLWATGGGCADQNPGTAPLSRAAGPLGVTWSSERNLTSNGGYPFFVDGFVRTGAAQTVEARFADGATATIPVTTWVSAPINAGFFAYTVPTAHRNRPDALRSIVALDANGNVVGSEQFRTLNWSPGAFVSQKLPDGTRALLPRTADLARAREMFSFRETDGTRVFLWVVPLTGGGACEVANQGNGCGPTRPVFSGGLYGGENRIVFFAQMQPNVATVELRYQNGENERLAPSDGFVVHDIAPAHHKVGDRLITAVALDPSGKPIETLHFQPRDPALYPCKKPISEGHGVETCP